MKDQLDGPLGGTRREFGTQLLFSCCDMAVEEVNLQHGQGGRLRGKRRRSATDMGVEKAAPGRPTDQVVLL